MKLHITLDVEPGESISPASFVSTVSAAVAAAVVGIPGVTGGLDVQSVTVEETRPVVHTDYEGGRESMAALGDPIDPMPQAWLTVVDTPGPLSAEKGWAGAYPTAEEVQP